MTFSTADLCDAHGDAVRVLEEPLSDFGAHRAFSGMVTTLRAYQDNGLVRGIVSEPGAGRVLVVDGGGSPNCAMLGDQLAALAVANGWAGIVVFGCVRDAAKLASMPIGIRALGTSPRRSVKRGQGLRDVPLAFGGIDIRPGDHLFADEDGVVVASHPLAAD
jgi:regulator of ribonuclease activity A